MILGRFLDTPLALEQRAANEMLDRFRTDLMAFEDTGVESAVEDDIEMRAQYGARRADGRSFDLVQRVGIIPITGMLVHASTHYFIDVGYSQIGWSFSDAMADSEVRAIALQIGSPGGEVAGLFDLVDSLHGARGTKPVWAILDDHAYSAAYAVASAADKVFVPRTGGVGSIGVLTAHMDVSEALKQQGINVTLVQYGERKTDYSPFKPLSDGAKARLQADVDAVGEMFVESVARNRKIARAKVRNTEAALFMGAAGVEAGLADAVSSPQEAFNALVKKVS